MAKGKPPAFLFYADAWLSSTDILLMSPSEEGAYIRLLCHAWLSPDCGLPTSDEELATMSRLYKQWPKSRSKVLKKFEEIDGRYFNIRLLEERRKNDEFRKKQQKNGSLRWDAKNSQALAKPGGLAKSGMSLADAKTMPARRNRNSSSFQEGECGGGFGEGLDCHALANELWEIHPAPSNLGGVVIALEEEAKCSPIKDFGKSIKSSLMDWVAYWAENRRYPTGLSKWVESGDYAKKPPRQNASAARIGGASPLETIEQRDARIAAEDSARRQPRA